MSDETTDTNSDTDVSATSEANAEWRAPSQDEFERALKAASDASWATARKHYESRTPAPRAPTPAPTPGQAAASDYENRARQMSDYLSKVRLTGDERRTPARPTTPGPSSGGSAAERLAELMLLERMEQMESKRAAAVAALPPPSINGQIDREVSTLDPSLTGEARALKVREIANRHLRNVKVTAVATGDAHLGPRRK